MSAATLVGKHAPGGHATVVVFAPKPAALRWVTEELVGEHYVVETATTAAELVAKLQDRSSASPRVAVIDFLSLTDRELARVCVAREDGWSGVFVSLGAISFAIRDALRIRFVFDLPFGSERLRKAVDEVTGDRRKTGRHLRRRAQRSTAVALCSAAALREHLSARGMHAPTS